MPKKFTFPFYYTPHPIALQAAEELQNYLNSQKDWKHNFGLNPNEKGMPIGKMFGVLVVKNQENKMGYITAFSGKLSSDKSLSKFVPHVNHMPEKENFIFKGMREINDINQKVKELENTVEYIKAQVFYKQEVEASIIDLEKVKNEIKQGKKNRKKLRNEKINVLDQEAFSKLAEQLKTESLGKQFYLKHLTEYWDERLEKSKLEADKQASEINFLKQKRKQLSTNLQQQLFDCYSFLNAKGESQSLESIFENTAHKKPPSGAGECAAPKLLQYAFKNNLIPIALAEFWWGKSPNAEIRKHGQYYPACRGKCEPILKHMLNATPMDVNPMLENTAAKKEIKIIYEDDFMAVINKPPELLSVPGKDIKDCVVSRMQTMFPKANGPLIVHRLDMSTSGIMLIAKSLEVHKVLQSQFINRTIKKRYIALLNGSITKEEGTIKLPLKIDYNDRPRQLVCFEHGKEAVTDYKTIDIKDDKTRIYFYPLTGRTHQLRIHAAHVLGLNTPILGDDLYGVSADRLYLHADFIKFTHPTTKKTVEFKVQPDF